MVCGLWLGDFLDLWPSPKKAVPQPSMRCIIELPLTLLHNTVYYTSILQNIQSNSAVSDFKQRPGPLSSTNAFVHSKSARHSEDGICEIIRGSWVSLAWGFSSKAFGDNAIQWFGHGPTFETSGHVPLYNSASIPCWKINSTDKHDAGLAGERCLLCLNTFPAHEQCMPVYTD